MKATSHWIKCFLGVLIVAIGNVALGPSHAQSPEAVCKDLQRLLRAPPSQGIERYALEPSVPVGGKEDGSDHYFNVDVDGDDVSDFLSGGCSRSSMPADPCLLSLETSSGSKYTFEEGYHLLLVRHKARIYAITADQSGGKTRSAFVLGAKDYERVCSDLE